MCIEGVTGLVASLTSLSRAECEWGSMMPGVSHMAGGVNDGGGRGRIHRGAHAGDFACVNPDGAVLDGAVAGGHHGGVFEDDV